MNNIHIFRNNYIYFTYTLNQTLDLLFTSFHLVTWYLIYILKEVEFEQILLEKSINLNSCK